MPNVDIGQERTIPNLPKFPGSHPSISPDGKLFATDTTLETFAGSKKEWGVVVGDPARVYFNASEGRWTQVYVAEAPDAFELTDAKMAPWNASPTESRS